MMRRRDPALPNRRLQSNTCTARVNPRRVSIFPMEAGASTTPSQKRCARRESALTPSMRSSHCLPSADELRNAQRTCHLASARRAPTSLGCSGLRPGGPLPAFETAPKRSALYSRPPAIAGRRRIVAQRANDRKHVPQIRLREVRLPIVNAGDLEVRRGSGEWILCVYPGRCGLLSNANTPQQATPLP